MVMVCPYCHKATDVVNSRPSARQFSVWRRRRCIGCGEIFSTYESPDLSKVLLVSSLDEQLTSFSRDKLFISVFESIRHRSDALNDAPALTQTIIEKLIKQSENGKLYRDRIVRTTHEALKRFDKAAAVQYLAYHPL